jgi:phenylpropionate dioxygenase-like ring-hydroxylating dioxygenase large terminal subunit
MLVTKHPVFRRFWYPVIRMADLAGGPKPFTLLGTDIVLWLDATGAPAAALDRCCHRTAKLSRGFCDSGNIVCGYHGWTFDRSGQCVRVPQMDDNKKLGFKVPAYRCAERYGYAWVALDEPLYDIPEIPEAAQGMRRIDQFYEVWKCCGLRLMENSFDIAHPAFVHRKTFGIQSDPSVSIADLAPFDGGFQYRVESDVRNTEIQKKNLGIQSDTTRRIRTNTWWMPFIRRLGITYPNRLKHTIITAATPIDDAHSMLVQFCYRSDTEAEAPAADIVAFDREVTLEDKHILEGTDPDVQLAGFADMEKSMVSDRPGLLMRRMLRDLLIKHGEMAPSAIADAAVEAAE